MKRSRIVLASVFAAGLFGASIALAQPPGDMPEHGHGHGHGEGHGQKRGHGGPEPEGMGPGPGPGASAYAPGHWRKGDRLPPEYRERQYVIDDWREYHLAPPPRGYQWVGIGGDYLIVQIGSGIVLRVGP